MLEVGISGSLDLAEIYNIPLSAGAVYVVAPGSEEVLSVDSVTGIVTPLSVGSGSVLIQDQLGRTWQPVSISVLSDSEAEMREYLTENPASLTTTAAILESGGNSMTDRGIIGGFRLIDNSTPDAKLQTISTAGKVANSATTATAVNQSSAIVARDGDGKFAAAMVTLTGTVANSTDAATKAYVDSVAQGLDIKASVRAATTANITLSGTQTIDGVEVVAGDRVLVKNQTTATQNGVYVVASGAWARAVDFDTADKVSGGAFLFVEEGTIGADTGWVVVSDGPLTVGTDTIAFTQFSGAGAFTAGAGLTADGTTFNVVAADGTIVVNADSIQVGEIANANVAANAAIAYSKLNLASSIVNSDVAANAAIAYSKLALTGSILNADLAGSITDDKLNQISSAGKVANSATTGTASDTAETLVLRDASGRAKFADPAAAQDAATKNYVDNLSSRVVINEVPTGTIDGTNAAFTLANIPAAGTLQLFVSGLLLIEGTHFTRSDANVTFTSPFEPQAGEWLRASYTKA